MYNKNINMNNEFLKMQKLAGLITENQAKEASTPIKEVDDIFNDQYSVSDEAYERMDSLVNINDYNNFIQSATNIMNELTDEGFEVKDVFYYLYTRLTADV
jgi:hypothetical protein